MSTLNQIQKTRQQLVDLREAREQIVSASTAEKLKRLDSEAADLREMLASLERVQSSVVSNNPPSAEESELWSEIREIGDREQGILRDQLVPSQFIRPDALEHFEGELKSKRVALEQATQGMKYSSYGPRIRTQFNELENAENTFATRVKPLCLAGEKLFKLREKKRELLARRDELKAQREQKILANA